MDILNEIKSQINSIKKVDNSTYLGSILTHLERAEYYYKQGKNDSNYFNDVIYRGNQAYEGSLKEAYKVLADKSTVEVIEESPNNIEKYLQSNQIFRPRVLQLFRNYRQEWRNKSTHEYQFFFDESEAFLALTSVSSFVHILLKQIQEKVAFNVQHQKLSEKKNQVEEINLIAKSSNSTPQHKLIELIRKFVIDSSMYIVNSPEFGIVEIMGLFHAFIAAVDGLNIQREPIVKVLNVKFAPDFIISVDNVPILLEFKRYKDKIPADPRAIDRVLLIMEALKIHSGIIFYANFTQANKEVKVITDNYGFGEKKYVISSIIAF